MHKKKSLGQNFLTNHGVIRSIAGCIDISRKSVLEVGPGEGALTTELLTHKPRSIDLIELDDRLIPLLRGDFGDRVAVHHGDVLKSDVVYDENIHVSFGTPRGGGEVREYIVFGNIPYYITSPIITHFLYDVSDRPSHMVLMMQKEVADKIRKKDGKNSVLSLSCDLMCTKISKVIDVSPGSFSPPPKISSTVLLFELDPRSVPDVSKKILNLIKIGFAQKRKKLLTNLKSSYSLRTNKTWEAIFDELRIDHGVRAEDVELHVWKGIMEHINQ